MPTEALTPQVVDGSRQLAIEIKAQRELALSNPRKEIDIFKKAIAALAFAPEFAEHAYYSIPYNEGKENETLVEGLSVVASRDIARLWTNCASAWRIIGQDEDAFELEGIFADFETNVFFRSVVRVPKFYFPKGSSIKTPLREDRLNTAIQAGGSKAERNAMLKGIPEWFKERYFTEAKKIAGQKGKAEGKTDAERLDACYAGFAKFGVAKDRVAAYVAEKLKGKSTDEIIGTMIGVWNAIKDKQAKAEDIFPTAKAEEKPGAVNLNDIKGADL